MTPNEFTELTNEQRLNLLRSYKNDVDRLHKAVNGIVGLIEVGFVSFDLAHKQVLNAIRNYMDALNVHEEICSKNEV